MSDEPSKADLAKVAAYLGSKGGKSRSKAKKNASRENGKKGGRPRSSVRKTDSNKD